MKIFIARHGITSWNKEGRIQGQTNDIPLSEEGKKQMERLGAYLAKHTKHTKNPIILLSPLMRSQESFAIINRYLHVPENAIHTLPELIEMNFGKFEAQLKSEIQSDVFFTERKKDKYKTAYPNGESYEDVYKRLSQSSLLELFQKAVSSQQDMIFVGHESTNRIIPLALHFPNLDGKTAAAHRQKNNEVVVYTSPFKERVVVEV